MNERSKKKVKEKLIVILGPTATGKTDLALMLAKKLNGELVSCDSRQVYKDLDILSGKEPGSKSVIKKHDNYWEIDGVVVWLYDVADVKDRYSVADYVKDARAVIKEISERGKTPIVVGGTGFYLKALLEGLSYLSISIDEKLRVYLSSLTKEQLQEKLRSLSMDKWDSLNNSDKQNPRRLVRAIELLSSATGSMHQQVDSDLTNFNILKVGLTARRDFLYKRVNRRVVKRIDEGMIEEAEDLYKKGLSLERMRQLGLECGVMADYLDRRINDKNELVLILQSKIRNYLRRQLTWFKNEKDVNWFNIDDKSYFVKLEKSVMKWYDGKV